MNHVPTRASEESGTAIIEMAFVLPLLLLLILAVVDFGRALNYWNDTNQLAAEGARHAVVNRNPGSGSGLTLQQYIRSRAETEEVREGTTDSVQSRLRVCIEAVNGSTNVGDPIRVRVVTRYYVLPLIRESVEDVFGADGWGSIGLSGEATMRLEQKYDPVKLGAPGCDPGV